METDAKTLLDGTILCYSGDTKERAMGKVLRCQDLGMKCTHEIRAETEEELLKLAAEHAEKDHGIHATSIPPSILAMVKAAIRDE
jgi:predicted small metal-binding protein